MDESKLYIRMVDHPLIQDGWKLKPGDCVYWPLPTPTMEVFNDIDVESWTVEEIKAEHGGGLWLLRQEDWQGMLDDTEDRKLSKIEKWTNKTYLDHWKPWGVFETWEQLWAGFTMNELHQLKWDGNNWISNKGEK